MSHRLPLSLLLLSALAMGCASTPRPSEAPVDTGPVARVWRRSADARDFQRFTSEGTVLSADGALELDAATARTGPDPFAAAAPATEAGAPTPVGSALYGRAVSEEQLVPGGFNNVVPSFDALTPPGTWVRVTLAARVEGQWTRDYDFGAWAFDTGTVARHSVEGQKDAHGRVLTDTLVLSRKADALRMTVWLFSSRPGVSPRVRALAAALTDTSRTPADDTSARRARGRVLEVPGRSQLLYPDGGGWCSPTSVSMLLGYWAQRLGRSDLVVPVPVAAEHTLDRVYQGTGNWSFNTAYAAALGNGALHGMVARLDSFAQVEALIAAGIPVSISIAFEPGQLTGAPVSRSDGHLIVVKGFTPEGDVVCNDPAFPSDDKVEVTYRRDELWRVWRHSKGMAYVLWPAGTALPAHALSTIP
jgi:hypothetical protein